MKLLPALLCLAHSSLAHQVSLKFPGYGFSWYAPACAYACNNAVSGAMLPCSVIADDMSITTSPECYANNMAYLTTLALCMRENCDPATVPIWQREKYWITSVTGHDAIVPKWDYSEALAQITELPTAEYNSTSEDTLVETMLVPPAAYETQYTFNIMFDHLEKTQASYCFTLITVGFGTPILLTLLARLPFLTTLFDKLKPYLVYPSSFGSYNVRALPRSIGNAPTIGQAMYVAMFFILNLVLSSVNYSRHQPHPWGFGPKEELLAYIGYRTGHIGYALLPLVILFSGRNNFLLWVTNWSYATYIVLHRWVARIFAIQVVVHSITMLLSYKGTGEYAANSKQAYWLWGIVATVMTCAMLVLSQLYFRRLAYEAFLILHIALAVFVIVGCWYHVVLRFGMNFYTNWLYAASAVWFFDRLVRVLRVAKNGIRRADVVDVGPDHVRIDVRGLRWANTTPGCAAYVYFPTLNVYRPWKNHPFSVISSAVFRGSTQALESVDSLPTTPLSDHDNDLQRTEKAPRQTVARSAGAPTSTAGVTFLVKKSAGLTKLLGSRGGLLTLLDGPYSPHSSSDILQCERVLLIGGGVGVTGLLPWLAAHSNVKMAWSAKVSAKALVEELDAVLASVADKEVLVGQRLDLGGLLRREARAGYGKVGVVVCGPPGMCDEVRATVAALGRGGGETRFELQVEAFSW